MGKPQVHLTREALDERRQKVASLLAQGMSPRQIAKHLKVDKSDIERDAQVVRPVFRSVLGDTAQDVYVTAVSEVDEAGRELWANYREIPKKNKGMRLAYLNSILTVPERRVRLGQSLGIIATAPERSELIVKVQRALADVLMEAEPEEADALVKKLLDVANTP